VVGFALLFLGVLLTAPEADSPRPTIRRWWQALALAAFVFLIGLGLSFIWALAGGILVLLACVASVIVVVLVWQAEPPDPARTGRAS